MPPPITPAATLPSAVAPENHPIASAVVTPPGRRATSNASCAVVATDQPTPFSAESAPSATGEVVNGISANATAEHAPPSRRKAPPRRTEYVSPAGSRAASEAIANAPMIAPIEAGPSRASRDRYTGITTDSALPPATKKKTERYVGSSATNARRLVTGRDEGECLLVEDERDVGLGRDGDRRVAADADLGAADGDDVVDDLAEECPRADPPRPPVRTAAVAIGRERDVLGPRGDDHCVAGRVLEVR